MRFLGLLILVSFVVSCGEVHSSSQIHSAYGENDFKIVTAESIKKDNFAKAMGAVVILGMVPGWDDEVIPTQWCSGFKVSKKHILTNDHCVRKSLFFDQGKISTGFDKLIEYEVDDAYRLDCDGEVRSTPTLNDYKNNMLGEPIIFDYDLDFALYELPESQWSDEFVDLREIESQKNIGKGEPKKAKRKKSIMYSFPTDAPLVKSENCSILVKNEYTALHTCDSLTGSSGGLIVDVESKTPIALHHQGGGKTSYQNYKKNGSFKTPELTAKDHCLAEYEDKSKTFDECVQYVMENKAIPLASIFKLIKQQNIEIYD